MENNCIDNKIRIQKTHDTVLLPEKSFGNSLAHNVYAELDTIIRPNEIKEVSSGIKVFSENKNKIGFYFLGEKSKIGNGFVETIDSWCGLENTLKVRLYNRSSKEIKFKKDDLIGKVITFKTIGAEWEEVYDLGESLRGEKGFGSTGTK